MRSAFVILACLALPFSALAAQPPPPLCAGMGCTARMQSIAAAFEAARAPALSELPLLASGECYHLSIDYNPETTHYGVVLLDARDGAAYMGGVFGFFFPENPYRAWTAETVRAQSANFYADNHRLELTSDYAYADMNPGGQEMWLYWIKRSGTRLYVIGQWGTRQRLFCELAYQ